MVIYLMISLTAILSSFILTHWILSNCNLPGLEQPTTKFFLYSFHNFTITKSQHKKSSWCNFLKVYACVWYIEIYIFGKWIAPDGCFCFQEFQVYKSTRNRFQLRVWKVRICNIETKDKISVQQPLFSSCKNMYIKNVYIGGNFLKLFELYII